MIRSHVAVGVGRVASAPVREIQSVERNGGRRGGPQGAGDRRGDRLLRADGLPVLTPDDFRRLALGTELSNRTRLRKISQIASKRAGPGQMRLNGRRSAVRSRLTLGQGAQKPTAAGRGDTARRGEQRDQRQRNDSPRIRSELLQSVTLTDAGLARAVEFLTSVGWLLSYCLTAPGEDEIPGERGPTRPCPYWKYPLASMMSWTVPEAWSQRTARSPAAPTLATALLARVWPG